jgi:hypothetical protein
MSKISFELELTAKTLTDVQEVAEKHISSFLEIDRDEVLANVDVEYKVHIGEGNYKVTCYASVKRSIARIS